MSESDAVWSQISAMVAATSDKALDPHDLRPENNLYDDLGITSLMAVHLVLDLEREFGIIIREEDFDRVETVGDLKRLVDSRRAEMA
jgi:acyl carrier protein